MLDTSLNQGAGLHSIPCPALARVIAVASHGDSQSELPLLWNLCIALASMSTGPLAVLDGTTPESIEHPGLSHFLEDGHKPYESRCGQPAWDVIPAARGLEKLCQQPRLGMQALNNLGNLLRSHGTIVMYAPADLLGTLMADSGAHPLLLVSSTRTSRVTAYQSLKRMLLNCGLRPTIATMVVDSRQSALNAGQALSNNLQDCAMYFLGYKLDVTTLPVDPDSFPNDMNRLAVRLLESALSLQRNASEMFCSAGHNTTQNMVRSH